MVYPEEQIISRNRQPPLSQGHKKCPNVVEQIDRLLREVDYYHFLDTTNVSIKTLGSK
ncbi:TPA_asm: hypothetical protein [Porphyromonas phage phage023a_KCOM2797]|uniref:Uncharacterized protein n=1 Tax=Porphyromonas phage phage023a_KCOM2797 TaxID=3154113 RepID=A0AAT9JDV8_9CAUD